MEKVGFLGKSGIGKSTIISHISRALVEQGYRVLQIGNDIGLNSTTLLYGGQEVYPFLEAFHQQYVLNIAEYIYQGEGGVYCLELGGCLPGIGCKARSLELVNEIMVSQGLFDTLKLDFVFYDVSMDAPCGGDMLPIRSRIWDRVVILTNPAIPSLLTANNIVTAISHSFEEEPVNIQLVMLGLETSEQKQTVLEYSKVVGIPIIGSIGGLEWVQECYKMESTCFKFDPAGELAFQFYRLADEFVMCGKKVVIHSIERLDLLHWLRHPEKRLADAS